LKVRLLPAGREALAQAVRIINGGGVVALPTDTVYGLGCDPFNGKAVGRLFKVKDRQANPVPLLCADSEVAEKLVELNGAARRLARLHWPGALTIVARLKKGSKVSPLLDQGTGYLGVRVPMSELCVEIAAKVGGALTGTSANVSGRPSCRTAAEVIESLDGKVDLVIDGGELRGMESTVVKASGEGIEVLREGSVRIQEGDTKP
jgi:L-threonylcarbamoyladenylate synthase